MDYSFAYAKRRGLVGGNPTIRYILSDKGRFVPARGAGRGLYVGAKVLIIGLDDYLIGEPEGLGCTGVIIEEDPPWYFADCYSKPEYQDLKAWRVEIHTIWGNNQWTYWEHDLEII